jgi:hypothetical protein
VKALARILLMFHGGGFVSGQPSIPDAEAAAPAHCRVVEVNYTLGNLAAAWADSRLAAKRAARHAPVVLAYGESAGAAIAGRLAEDGLVDAASAFLGGELLARPLLCMESSGRTSGGNSGSIGGAFRDYSQQNAQRRTTL